jgi:hypothetical protein
MKLKNSIYCTIALTILSCLDIRSQNNLQEALSQIKDKIGEVQIDKISYRQAFDILDEEKGKINYSIIEVDEKGKTEKESFEFYIADIDKNTLVRKPSGKKLFVSISVNNEQKFIKHFVEDKLDGYVNNIEILALNSDVALEEINLFKTAISLVKPIEKDWSSSTDALNWLKNNIGEVKGPTSITSQTLSYGERKEYLVTLNVKKTDQKGTTTDEKYEFNVLDINKNLLVVKISGVQLSVSIETSGNNKYIKYTKNNEQQSYTDDLEILAQDIDNARKIIAAFGSAIVKSKSKMPEFNSLQQALDFIKNSTIEITTDAKPLKQKIDFTQEEGTKTKLSIIETDSKGNSIENLYNFYLAHLEINSLNFKVSGKKISILCNTSNKIKLIKYEKDNFIQNFQNDIEILEPDIETTREVIEAFKYAVKYSEWKPVAWKNMSEANAFLKNTVKGENIGTDQYKLNFEGNENEPFFSKYVKSKTDAKGLTVEQSYEFYPYMLDATTTKIESSGKYLIINVKVSNKKSFVKVYKDGKQQSYDNELEIMAFDAKQARDISEALKYIASNGKPKDKNWSDKQTAMDFVKENVGSFKNDEKEIKQKLELVNNDPCKISFTVNTIDDKGKTTEEIYELGLSDMNKMMVDYKISGKNVYVTLVCKNREKLVKVYKNGAQQSYGADLEILEDDVNTAKNIADALKSAIIQCESNK